MKSLLVALTFSLLLPIVAEAQKVSSQSKQRVTIVYNYVADGYTALDWAAEKAYAGKFKIIDVTEHGSFKLGYFKGSGVQVQDPRSMRQRAVKAKVSIAYILTPEGRVSDPRVLESSDQRVTDVVLRAMKFWRNTPDRYNRLPIFSLYTFEQTFGGTTADDNGIQKDGLGIQGYRDR